MRLDVILGILDGLPRILLPLPEPRSGQVQARQRATQLLQCLLKLIRPYLQREQIEVRYVVLVVYADAGLKLLYGFLQVTHL